MWVCNGSPVLQPQTRVEDVAKSVAGEVESENSKSDGAGRGDARPGVINDDGLRLVEHDSPGLTGVCAGRKLVRCDEPECRFCKDCDPQSCREQNDDGRHDVWQYVVRHRADVGCADDTRRVDVVLLPGGEDDAAHDPLDAGYTDDA